MNKNETNWKSKVSEFFDSCSGELKKTTKIGMKMIGATKINSDMKDKLESLGKILLERHESGDQELKKDEVDNLVNEYRQLKDEMDLVEKEVHDIKGNEKKEN